MAEPEYPVAFGWLFTPSGGEPRWEKITSHGDECRLEFFSRDKLQKVELIPRPVHDRLVAEAVAAERAAERERCAAIAGEVAESCRPANRSYMDAFEREAYDTAQLIAAKIREVPQ